MTTLMRRLPHINPDSIGLPSIAPTQDEIDLLGAQGLLHWWDAGSGYSAKGWRCRKTGALLVPERTSRPTLNAADAAYNGTASLAIANGNAQLWDKGANLYPLGEHTLLVAGRGGPAQNSFPVGAATIGQATTTRYQFSSTGGQNFIVNSGPPAGPSRAGPLPVHPYAEGPVVTLMSHKPQAAGGAEKAVAVRRIDVATGATVEVLDDPANCELGNVHREMHVGAVNPYGSAAGGAVVGGDIAIIMLLSRASHLADNLALRDLAERVVRKRLKIPAI
jgi:hypothetical protein